MSSSLLSLILLFFLRINGTFAALAEVEYIYPNFSASHLLYLETNGFFLTSRNGTFQAGIYKPGTQQDRYYFSVLHTSSSTVVWTANRNIPISDQSSMVNLTAEGLSASYANGSTLWFTPPLTSRVVALHLLDTGNMMLLDAANNSLWQSFDHPTDTILSGQFLPAGSYLSSSMSDTIFSEGNYRLNVTTTDAMLSWLGSIYWRLSNDINSIMDKNAPVSFLTTNDSGLYLVTSDGAIIFEITLPSAPLRIANLGFDGHFQIMSYQSPSSSMALGSVFMAPSSSCDLPLRCGSLGLCLPQGNSSSCTCPPKFASSTHSSSGCSPANGNLISSNSSCDRMDTSYTSVGGGVTYFANNFMPLSSSGQNQSDCETLCTSNCSCTGYFYDNSSQSCFILQQPLGSLANTSKGHGEGYIKINTTMSRYSSMTSSTRFLAILLPSIAAFLVAFVVFGAMYIWCRMIQKKKMKKSKSALTMDTMHGSHSRPIADSDRLVSEDGDEIEEKFLPDLPNRFTLEELEEVTNNFRTKIGSGGFGTVYKGELANKNLVAVKKIEGAGVQRRKEFFAEIVVIGSIHHVNLVRLRGFCAQGPHWLLVYEYMNRGSLDRSLFRPTSDSLLEWSERMNVAICAARGLAYLHSGCQPKIVHCDVKPENILLADNGQVKIADFGLAKLMTPEQSGLFTTMRGTRGYLAPEWLTNTAISDRTDVYSFGMVLLELIRGKKNRSEHIGDGESKWSASTSTSQQSDHLYFPFVALKRHEQKSYEELADPRLEGRVEVSELERMVKTALCCLHEDPSIRPSMTSVVAMLEGTMEAWEPQIEFLGFLRMYGQGGLSQYNNGTLEIEEAEFMNKNFVGGSRTSTATNSGFPSYWSAQQLSGPR